MPQDILIQVVSLPSLYENAEHYQLSFEIVITSHQSIRNDCI